MPESNFGLVKVKGLIYPLSLVLGLQCVKTTDKKSGPGDNYCGKGFVSDIVYRHLWFMIFCVQKCNYLLKVNVYFMKWMTKQYEFVHFMKLKVGSPFHEIDNFLVHFMIWTISQLCRNICICTYIAFKKILLFFFLLLLLITAESLECWSIKYNLATMYSIHTITSLQNDYVQ